MGVHRSAVSGTAAPCGQCNDRLGPSESGVHPAVSGAILSKSGRIMDRLQAMNVLLAVVEAGSLSAASRRLKVPLATVSRRIAELEAHLGAKLLNRTSRTLGLTDAGRDYVAAARRILDDVAEAERAAAGEYAAPKGDLIITAPLVFGRLHVLPVVVEFLKAYREVDIRLVLNDRIVSLAEDHVDLARADRRAAGQQPGRVAGRVDQPGRLRQPGLSGGARRARRPAELAGHDCITFDNLGPAERWSFPHGRPRGRRGDPLQAFRQHRRGGARRRNCRHRHHPRAVLPGGGSARRRRIAMPARRISSRRRRPCTSCIPADACCHASCAPFSNWRCRG